MEGEKQGKKSTIFVESGHQKIGNYFDKIFFPSLKNLSR